LGRNSFAEEATPFHGEAETSIVFEKVANAKTAMQRRNSIRRTKLEDHYVRGMHEDFFAKMLLGTIHGKATHCYDFKLNFEFARLPKILDGLIQKSGFRWKGISGNHAGTESSDLQTHRLNQANVSQFLDKNQSHNDACKHFMQSGHRLTTMTYLKKAHSFEPGCLELGICIHLCYKGFLMSERAKHPALLVLFFFGFQLLFCLNRVQAGTLAQFHTHFGDIEVELYDRDKPQTVQNFKRLVESGAFQNTFFHRLQPGFVIQGGGYATAAQNATNLFAPPWSFVYYVPNFGNVTNEFNVGPHLSNTNGTIAMAKTSDPNSANSQFFFNLADNSASLDNTNNSGGFTVFGHVVRDANGILAGLNTFSSGNGIIPMGSLFPSDYFAVNVFPTLPVTYAGTAVPTFSGLVYVDISLLSVQLTLTNHQRQISWNSATGMTNIVEYSIVMPPVWNTLVTTNGNGLRYTITDPAVTSGSRFYRVRVN
jgi:cyclophilin family peptidyl-prolyl cis-trans isomerase